LKDVRDEAEDRVTKEALRTSLPFSLVAGVVNREVCAVTTIGTRTYCFLDDDKIFEKTKASAANVPGPLLVVKEVILPPSTQSDPSSDESGPPPACCEYGVAMVDAVNGTVTLGQFADDKLRSRLKTLLATAMPSEAVIHTHSSSDLLTMIKNTCGAVSVEFVNSKESLPKSTAVSKQDRAPMERPGVFDPWCRDACVSEMKRKSYFPRSSKEAGAEETMGRWPEVLKACVEGGADLAIGALGAGIFYLQRALVDYEIMSMAEVRAYVPPTTTGADVESTSNKKGNDVVGNLSKQREVREDGVDNNAIGEVRTQKRKKFPPSLRPPPPPPPLDTNILTRYRNPFRSPQVEHMAIDGITLENLELLVNLTDGKMKGSLWSKLNRTKTPHGNRLLKGWLLRPLFKKEDIERRANAVEELANGTAALAMTEASQLLNKVGDLERLLSRVHSMGSVEPGHPSNRQVLYEAKTHTVRKVKVSLRAERSGPPDGHRAAGLHLVYTGGAY
jgi:DNA mismatch repair protein MSH6